MVVMETINKDKSGPKTEVSPGFKAGKTWTLHGGATCLKYSSQVFTYCSPS